MRFEGVFPALTTYFDHDRPAPEKVAANIARLVPHGVAGFLVLGSTGEAPLLDEEEKVVLVAAARRSVPADRHLIVGVGLESTQATVRLARTVADLGADAVLVLTPHYFRARMTNDALLRHFAEVAERSPVPILLYNVPGFTGIAIPPAVVEALAAHPRVVGLKDSSGDIGWMVDVLSRVPADFQILSGSAFAFQPALATGAVGGILAVTNAIPEPYVAIARHVAVGEIEKALQLQKDIHGFASLLGRSLGVAGIKAAMDLRGLAGGEPRRPLLPISPEDLAEIAARFSRLVDAGVLARLEL